MLCVSKIVKTKKEHRCFGCRQMIPAGRMVDRFVNFEEFSHGYICEVCQILLAKNDYYDGVWYEGDTINDIDTWNDAASDFEKKTGEPRSNAVRCQVV